MEIDLAHEMRRVYTNIVRSRADNLPATLTIDEWVAILEQFQGMCVYCQTSPFTVLDHIIPHYADGGTTAEDCIPVCKRCNSRKRDYLVDGSLTYWERIEQVRTILRSGESIPSIGQPTRTKNLSERTTLNIGHASLIANYFRLRQIGMHVSPIAHLILLCQSIALAPRLLLPGLARLCYTICCSIGSLLLLRSHVEAHTVYIVIGVRRRHRLTVSNV